MGDPGLGAGNDPHQPDQEFFGRGDGFGRPPQQPYPSSQASSEQPQPAASADRSQQTPYGQGYGTGSGYAAGAEQYGAPGGSQRQTFVDQSSGGYPPPPNASTAAVGRPEPKRRGRAGVTVLSLALAAVIGGGVGVGTYAALGRDGGSASSPITVTTQQARQQAKTDGSIEDAAKTIEPSVVTITMQNGSTGDIGSGVVLDTEGHILTNNHVVSDSSSSTGGLGGGQFGRNGQNGQNGQSGASKITVTLSDGKTAQAKVVGTDETDDLAVLKVDGVQDLKPAKFAKSASLSVGQSVVAVGAPLGLSQSVTSGIVSNVARPVRSGNNNDAVYMAVQTDAAINPGNSGGPLVDLDGAVTGIDSSIASTGESGGSGSGDSGGNIGIGFAIPADVAVRVASELIADGHSDDAALGVTISGTDGSSLGSTTTGVELRSVANGSAAAKIGLRSGDVVTAVNDFKVTTSDGLIAATRYYAPGTKVKITYQRGSGQSKTATVTLGTA